MLPEDPQKKAIENEATQAGTPPAPPVLKDEHVAEAHEQADADIAQDPDFNMQSPNDDLDEGETARLGEDENALI